MKNSKVRIIIGILVVILITFLAFEFKSIDIDNRLLIMGIGIDYEDSRYTVYAEIMLPKNRLGSGGEPHKIVSGSGKDVSAALSAIYQDTGRYPSLGHCSIIVLSESVSNPMAALEYFVKSDSFRDCTLLAVCQGSVKQLMDSKTSLEDFSSLALEKQLLLYGQTSGLSEKTLHEFNLAYYTHSKSTYLPYVVLRDAEQVATDSQNEGGNPEENQSSTLYDCSRLALFSDGKLVCVLNDDQTVGLQLIDKKSRFATYDLKEYDSQIGLVSTSYLLKDRKLKITAELVNNTPKISVDISIILKRSEADIIYEANALPNMYSAVSESVKQQVAAKMYSQINEYLKKAAEHKSDAAQFSNLFYAKYGTKWDDYLASNPNFFSRLTTQINIKVS